MPKEKLSLNENQDIAIHHTTGPILVVAGAGTGKTRVITERIKWLIQEGKFKPSEILALTFTEKAAQEMSNRVGDVMPLGYEEPWIYTFHSFADRILRIEGLEIGLDPSYKILSGPNQWIMLRKNIFKLDLKYFRPMGNPTKFISAFLKFISRLQDENISSEDFSKFAKEFSGSVEEKARWTELAHIYESYQKIKLQHSKLDFGDLITWTLQLFKQRPNVLKKYQEQFKHVLVDEFQDTNYAQYELVKVLCPNDMTDRSLLSVGDDNQAVYRFRGAAVSNILDFIKDYPKAKTVILNQNYRSTQPILDAAYNLIQNNNPDTLESKLGISKQLTAKGILKDIVEKPEIVQLKVLEDEVEWVISKIYEVLAKEPNYTYKDIAILARANNHLEPFVLSLRKHGLPYQLVGNRGLYDQDEIRDTLALIKVIINPRDTISLYRSLNIDTLKVPQHIITDLLSQARYKKMDIWELILDYQSEPLQLVYKLITEFQDKITKATPVEFIYTLVNKTRYIDPLLEKETVENELRIKNMNLFLNIVKKFEIDYRDENKEAPTIVNFVDYIDMLIEAGDNPAQAEIEDVDTINLLTVHSSKGLEFPVVFMIDLIAGRFPSMNRSDPIEIPEQLIKETLPTGDEHIQEERRLFYVGTTRAKKYLYMCLAKNYGGKKDSRPSGYLQETGLKIKEINEMIGEKQQDQKSLFGVESQFRDPVYKKINFTPSFLSYSQIDTYKTCPLMYKYRYILNIPTPPSAALSFGSTIHDTLRDFHQQSIFKPITLEELYKIYEKNWQPLGYEDEDHRRIRFEEGKNILKNYFEKHAKDRPLELERSFNIKIDGIKFYGRIDRIDALEDGSVEIIDYKTGSTKEQKYVDKDDQVAFYALAAKEALGLEPKKLTYYFVENDEQVSTTRTPEQLVEKKAEIVETIGKIKKGEFNATPGMHCTWCDFKDICPFAYKG